MADEKKDTQNTKSISLTSKDWVEAWEKKNTGFHKADVHPMLKKHINVLVNGREKVKIFYPLCGKAVDMKWLADMGHTVVGVDVAEQGLKEFFEEQNLEYVVESLESVNGKLYKSKKDMSYQGYEIEHQLSLIKDSGKILCLAIFRDLESDFGAVWDRGSLVAINKEDRGKYTATIKPLLTADCQYLVELLDYDPNKYGGPPHYVSEDDLKSLYSDVFDIKKIDRVDYNESKERENFGLDYLYIEIYMMTYTAK